MRRLITKFPKPNEEIFCTKIEVAYINGDDELKEITTFLTGLEFEITRESDNRITGIHSTPDPAIAEHTVQTLGKNSFSDYCIPASSAAKEGHTDLC